MKIRVMLKDPDALNNALVDAVIDDLNSYPTLDDEERAVLQEMRTEKYTNLASKWFKNGEYLTVEIDTDTKTAVVVAA